VLLAACGSSQGASSFLIEQAQTRHWKLLVSPYVLSEVENNLSYFGNDALPIWISIQQKLACVTDIYVVDWPVVFKPTKDKPVLFTAFAYADILLTLDEKDFGKLMPNRFYGLPIMRPGQFLARSPDTA